MSAIPPPASPAPHVADAFGQALWHWVQGEVDLEIYERPDGYMEAGPGPDAYLAEYRDWPAAERAMVRLARGRVVDVGCGAGRVALYLQDKGRQVTAIDASAHAVRATRHRGVTDVRRMTTDDLTCCIEGYDTVILFGNNLGIFGTPEQVRLGLTQWARHMRPGARLLVESTSPHGGGVPTVDRAWRLRNRAMGRMAGHTDLRIRYRQWTTPWFSWLFVSPAELRTLLRGTGWQVTRVEAPGPSEPYVAVLELGPSLPPSADAGVADPPPDAGGGSSDAVAPEDATRAAAGGMSAPL